VDKGDKIAVRAEAWPLVDQPHAGIAQAGKLRSDVGDPVGYVMEPGWLIPSKPIERRTFSERFEQLDGRVAGAHADDVDALIFNPLAVADFKA
jgi:hypothetical protein